MLVDLNQTRGMVPTIPRRINELLSTFVRRFEAKKAGPSQLFSGATCGTECPAALYHGLARAVSRSKGSGCYWTEYRGWYKFRRGEELSSTVLIAIPNRTLDARVIP